MRIAILLFLPLGLFAQMQDYHTYLIARKMNRLLSLLVFVLLMANCAPLKITRERFVGEVYVCNMGGMMGKTILTFTPDGFEYSERDSLLVGGGTWDYFEKGRTIKLKSKISNKHQSPDLAMEKELKL